MKIACKIKLSAKAEAFANQVPRGGLSWWEFEGETLKKRRKKKWH
jgi:hypothetical protein